MKIFKTIQILTGSNIPSLWCTYFSSGFILPLQ